MDRRNLFKALGAGIFGYEAVQHAAALPEIPKSDVIALQGAGNRMERYKKYEQFCADNPEYQNAINEWSDEMAGRIYKALDIESRKDVFLYKDPFSQWRLSLIIGYVAKYGDYFAELVHAPGKKPVRYMHLGSESMFRIETIKGKLIEFQQSLSGPDYTAIAKYPVEETYKEGFTHFSSTAIRFKPDHVVHIRARPRTLDEKKIHYPYGVSALYTGKLRMDKYFEEDVTEGIRELVERFKL